MRLKDFLFHVWTPLRRLQERPLIPKTYRYLMAPFMPVSYIHHMLTHVLSLLMWSKPRAFLVFMLYLLEKTYRIFLLLLIPLPLVKKGKEAHL